MEFADGGERVSAKVYRISKCGVQAALDLAKHEFRNLNLVHQAGAHRKMPGVPRPIGDFTGNGAVVSTKINGLPFQSLIMKAALLPDFGNHGLLQRAARQAGEWLRDFEKLCIRAKKDGLPGDFIESVLDYAGTSLSRLRNPVASSAVLNDFVPLNIMVTEQGIGFCEFAQLSETGTSLGDAAMFLAAVEALEKYPFCDRAMTTLVQDAFLHAYGITPQELQLLTMLKLKVLLQMFANGRGVKESAERKRVMWANVMKRFIQQAAERSMAPAA
jgi:hypothetical protein